MLGVLPSWFAAPSTFYKPLKIDIVRDKIKFAITKAFKKEKKNTKTDTCFFIFTLFFFDR
jgi:hypothetical protein